MKTRVTNPSPSLRWYHRNAQRNVELGLTALGKRRQRRPNARNRSQQLQMQRERVLENWNLRVSRLRHDGLTTRGTQRIYAVRRGDAVLLKAQLDAVAVAAAKCFDLVTPETQARLLELEKTLSSIRRQLV